MKKTYEKISIEIEVLNKHDVITASSSFDENNVPHVHDNGYLYYDIFDTLE